MRDVSLEDLLKGINATAEAIRRRADEQRRAAEEQRRAIEAEVRRQREGFERAAEAAARDVIRPALEAILGELRDPRFDERREAFHHSERLAGGLATQWTGQVLVELTFAHPDPLSAPDRRPCRIVFARLDGPRRAGLFVDVSDPARPAELVNHGLFEISEITRDRVEEALKRPFQAISRALAAGAEALDAAV